MSLQTDPNISLRAGDERVSRPVILMPLKLEIRYFEEDKNNSLKIASYGQPDVSKAKTNLSSNGYLKLQTEEKTFSKKQKEEFWLRWYPDDLHLQIPIGKITEEEKGIWARIEKDMRKRLSKTQGEEEARKQELRDKLTTLIDQYLKRLKEELVIVIRQNTTLRNKRLENLTSLFQEKTIAFHNELFRIFENKDPISLKLTAVENQISKYFSNFLSVLPNFLDMQQHIAAVKDEVSEIQKLLLRKAKDLVEQSQKNPEVAKRELGNVLKTTGESLLEKIKNLILNEIKQKTDHDSAAKISELTENMVIQSVEISYSEEIKDQKVLELLEFLESRPKDENTFYVDFVNKILNDIIVKIQDIVLLDLIKENRTLLEKEFGIIRARQLAKHLLLSKEGKSWNFDTQLDREDPLEILLEEGMQIKTLPP
ncbi:MAG: hypothetical protein EU544_04260, partial [Promethearchaeota archaeon]